MTRRLTTYYAKNYCNRTLIVKVIVENVVTCFLGTRCIGLTVNRDCAGSQVDGKNFVSDEEFTGWDKK